jgi:hypothetical protein
LAAAIGASVLRALLSRPKVVAVVHAGDDTAGAAATVMGAKAIETGVEGHRSGWQTRMAEKLSKGSYADRFRASRFGER